MKDYKSLLEYMIHEATQINAGIKSHAEVLGKVINDKKGIKHHSELIHEHSSALNTLIDLIVFDLNPDHFVSELPDKRNIHGKFKKCSISYRRKMKNKNISFDFQSDKIHLIDLYPVADTLPYLLFDNAVKYSHPDSEITVDMLDFNSYVSIKVENYGPLILPDETNMLQNKNYRGVNAQAMYIEGSGLGLSFVKQICNIHKAELKIETGKKAYELNGIPYGEFKVLINIPKEYS